MWLDKKKLEHPRSTRLWCFWERIRLPSVPHDPEKRGFVRSEKRCGNTSRTSCTSARTRQDSLILAFWGSCGTTEGYRRSFTSLCRYVQHLLSLLLLLAAGCTSDPSLRSTLADAEPLLRSGRAEIALQRLQEAQVDHPHSAALLFDIACARNAAAEDLESGEGAEKMYRAAHETFLRLTGDPSGEFASSAAFNAATVLLRLDAMLDGKDRYAERVENINQAVEELSALVEGEPDFAAAIHNLDYARYQRSLLLQNPPKEEDDEKEDEEEPPVSGGAVDAATTQIPQAHAEVLDGNTIVLRLPSRGEDGS